MPAHSEEDPRFGPSLTGVVRRALAIARAPGNAIAFEVRRRLRFRRGAPGLPAEPKRGLFDELAPADRRRVEAREQELRERYGLERLRSLTTRREYREVVDLTDLLDGISEHLPNGAGTLRAVDVGARNWSYVGALERVFAARAAELELTGIEVDGHALAPDGHARCDYAAAYAAQTGNPGVRYVVGDFRTWEGRGLDAVTLLFPFLTRYALLDWGLPIGLFDPQAIIDRAVEVLRPDGGIVISVHQTEVEFSHMLGHAEWLGDRVEVVAARPCPSRIVAHWPKTAGRHLVVLRRRA